METKRKGGYFTVKSVFRLALVVIVIIAIILHIPAPEKRAKIYASANNYEYTNLKVPINGKEDTTPVDFRIEVLSRTYMFQDITMSEADRIFRQLYAISNRTRALVQAAREFGFFGQNDDSEEIDNLISQYNNMNRAKQWLIRRNTLYATAKELGGKELHHYKNGN
ncbi:hypothetical protein IK146_00375 [Candidatus Saccharibacteria bacterium]|nr:hypothetical protein [Candidatus Saccharibacteria bacterium]